MNRRAWFWVCGVMVGMIILTKTPLMFTVFAFLVLGMIPGTTLSVPAWVLLTAYPLLFCAVIFWLSQRPLMIDSPATTKAQPLKKQTTSKKAKSARTTAAKRRPSQATS